MLEEDEPNPACPSVHQMLRREEPCAMIIDADQIAAVTRRRQLGPAVEQHYGYSSLLQHAQHTPVDLVDVSGHFERSKEDAGNRSLDVLATECKHLLFVVDAGVAPQ